MIDFAQHEWELVWRISKRINTDDISNRTIMFALRNQETNSDIL